MTTSIAYPSDAVVKGATEIQATTFALVPGDYSDADWPTIRRIVTKWGGQSNFPGMPSPNKFGNIDSNWQFFVRQDMTGDTALLRNFFGVQEIAAERPTPFFDVQNARKARTEVRQVRLEVYNWYPAQLTLTDTSVLTTWALARTSYTYFVDPESDLVLSGDGAHRANTEANGFLFTQVAANKPANTPAMKFAAGARMPF